MKYWLLIVWLSCKWMFRINLGDLVWYRGVKCLVLNGTTPNHWDLLVLHTDERQNFVHYNECRKVWTPSNMLGSFLFGYRFYMTSWFDIWKREGIKPWMKGCKIW